MSTQLTQNTAPVFRFNCLYTHDLVRKQKRWHDGQLSFHTFNKRVMVYDVLGNFVGDTHWRNEESVQEGDELNLDRGAIIQVAEETGRKEQDLTELFDRRAGKEDSPRRRQQQNGGSQYPTSASSDSRVAGGKPKSIHAILTGATAPLRKPLVVSTTSPRRPEETIDPDGRIVRNAKRQKVDSPQRHQDQHTLTSGILTRLPQGSSAIIGKAHAPGHVAATLGVRGNMQLLPTPIESMSSKLSSPRTSGGIGSSDGQEELPQISSATDTQMIQVDEKAPVGSRRRSVRINDSSTADNESQKPVQKLTSSKSRRKKLICQDTESADRPAVLTRQNDSSIFNRSGESFLRQNNIGIVTNTNLATAKIGRLSDTAQERTSSLGTNRRLGQVSSRGSIGGVTTPPRDQDESRSLKALRGTSMLEARRKPSERNVSVRNGQKVTPTSKQSQILRATDSDADILQDCAASTLGSPANGLAEGEADLGPWSREAFDLFGWREGQPKKVT